MDALSALLGAGVVVSAGATAYLFAGGAGSIVRARASPRTWGQRLSEIPLVSRLGEPGERGRRRSACLSELPVLLDVVTLGLSAGLSFDSSLELYCVRYRTELARASNEAMLSWRIGACSREEALDGMAEELGVAALGRFASVVGEALAFGMPLAEALERQAQVIRDEQRSQVEEEIERVPVKMLIPLGTLIVPAMFLAILGPLLGSALVVG